MIVDLQATSTSAVNRELVDLRIRGGAVALGRVLTLIVMDPPDTESAVEAANTASREHPCRILVPVRDRAAATGLDAEIRVGGDAGASEVVILRLGGELGDHARNVLLPLLLPDTPVVTWWPGPGPESPSTDPVGSLARRRITDAVTEADPCATLTARARAYSPGDTDLTWTRLTMWRALLATALDQPPFEPVTAATVSGAEDSPSADLAVGWLADRFEVDVARHARPPGGGLHSIELSRASGPVVLERPHGTVATLRQPGQPDRQVSLARRDVADCLGEELRRLDPDEI